MSGYIFNKFPVLELERVTLREMNPDKDLKAFYNYITDKRVNRFIAEDDIPANMQQAKTEIDYWASLFRTKRSVYWAIALNKTDKIIGTCGFNGWSSTHKRTEISYDLAYPYWGKGIMTETLKSVCNYSFAVMGVNRIQATVATDNIGSIKVLNKLGFTEEGLMKDYGILHGRKKDFHMYRLLAAESMLS